MHHARGTWPAGTPALLRPVPSAGHWRRPNEYRRGERMTTAIEEREHWVTKQQLADHLKVTRRWIELQQHHGLPYQPMGPAMNRYIVSEVEAWIRERFTPRET